MSPKWANLIWNWRGSQKKRKKRKHMRSLVFKCLWYPNNIIIMSQWHMDVGGKNGSDLQVWRWLPKWLYVYLYKHWQIIIAKYAGLFMALQPRIIACGTKRAAMGMAIRFLGGPLAMSATSIAVGLRREKLHTAIVQVLVFYT